MVASFGFTNYLQVGIWTVRGPLIARDTIGKAAWGVVLSVKAAGVLVMAVLMHRIVLKRLLPVGLIWQPRHSWPGWALVLRHRLGNLAAGTRSPDHGVPDRVLRQPRLVHRHSRGPAHRRAARGRVRRTTRRPRRRGAVRDLLAAPARRASGAQPASLRSGLIERLREREGHADSLVIRPVDPASIRAIPVASVVAESVAENHQIVLSPSVVVR